MRMIALIMMVFLVSPGLVAAVDPPDQTDLPAASETEPQVVRSYLGIIRNKTGYEVSIPSENSNATLLIPPHGWIEYTIWSPQLIVTAYHNGQPFSCLDISAHPQEYPFMCKKYDFIAEIIPPEPVMRRYQPTRQQWPLRQQPKGGRGVDQGVEALG